MSNYLRLFADPVLSACCETMSAGDDLSFLADMRRICHANSGVGLAAPQIGVLKRAVFIMPTGRGACYSMLNPVITRHSDNQVAGKEGCLSYPDVLATIDRWEWIEVDYLDRDWRKQHKYASGWEARIIQHECDHLDGICRVGDAWRSGVAAEYFANRKRALEAPHAPAGQGDESIA